MKEEITIRQAGDNDIAALVSLLADFQDDARRYHPYLAHGADVGNEANARVMLTDCAQNDGLVLIAESKGDALGFANCALGDDDGISLRPERHRAMEINDLYVVRGPALWHGPLFHRPHRRPRAPRRAAA